MEQRDGGPVQTPEDGQGVPEVPGEGTRDSAPENEVRRPAAEAGAVSGVDVECPSCAQWRKAFNARCEDLHRAHAILHECSTLPRGTKFPLDLFTRICREVTAYNVWKVGQK